MINENQLELTLLKPHDPSKCTCSERLIRKDVSVGYDEDTGRTKYKDEIGIFRKRFPCSACDGRGCDTCHHKGSFMVCFCGHRVEPVSKDETLNRFETQCAVATAVLDTSLDPALDAMRAYRDKLVKSGGFGAWASHYYDRVKAPVAALVRRNRLIRALFLTVVASIVFLQKQKQNPVTSSLVFLVGMVGIALTGLVYAFTAPARQKW